MTEAKYHQIKPHFEWLAGDLLQGIKPSYSDEDFPADGYELGLYITGLQYKQVSIAKYVLNY
jgi:hypothetical protein